MLNNNDEATKVEKQKDLEQLILRSVRCLLLLGVTTSAIIALSEEKKYEEKQVWWLLLGLAVGHISGWRV